MNMLTDVAANTALTTALGTVASEALATVNAIAPLAIPILGVFIVWKAGIRMFKTISSK